MATKIRLKRGGRKSKPYYRIVVQDSRVRSRGRELDVIGYYHPAARPEPVSEVNVHSALKWLQNGAETTDTAHSILSKLGVMKHHHDGTTPDNPIATLKGGVVENKGYNPPPPPQEEVPAPATESEVSAETDAEVVSAADVPAGAAASDDAASAGAVETDAS
jgi:small subunit ribosomal protein S16